MTKSISLILLSLITAFAIADDRSVPVTDREEIRRVIKDSSSCSVVDGPVIVPAKARACFVIFTCSANTDLFIDASCMAGPNDQCPSNPVTCWNNSETEKVDVKSSGRLGDVEWVNRTSQCAYMTTPTRLEVPTGTESDSFCLAKISCQDQSVQPKKKWKEILACEHEHEKMSDGTIKKRDCDSVSKCYKRISNSNNPPNSKAP